MTTDHTIPLPAPAPEGYEFDRWGEPKPGEVFFLVGRWRTRESSKQIVGEYECILRNIAPAKPEVEWIEGVTEVQDSSVYDPVTGPCPHVRITFPDGVTVGPVPVDEVLAQCGYSIVKRHNGWAHNSEFGLVGWSGDDARDTAREAGLRQCLKHHSDTIKEMGR